LDWGEWLCLINVSKKLNPKSKNTCFYLFFQDKTGSNRKGKTQIEYSKSGYLFLPVFFENY